MRTFLISLFLLSSGILSSAHAAETSPWSISFHSEAVAGHLDDTPARYMLVPAGAETAELTQAEQVLANALRASGRASLVMNAQALGSVSQLDDASIARRAAVFPVDRVVVLRLFPDASGALTQAVVSLYAMKGESLGSFSAVAGTALPTRKEQEGKQLESTEASPVAPHPPAPPTPDSPALPATPDADPRELYALRHIGFDELVAVQAGTQAVVSQRTVPYEGKYKKPLSGDSFYRKVGREDLVQAYGQKMNTKLLLGVVGGGAAAGGLLMATTSPIPKVEDCDFFSPDFDACRQRNDQRHDERFATTLTGLGISTAGIGLLTVALLLDPHPVTASEARELADKYNKQLAAELGLSEDGSPTPPPKPSVIQAHLTPVVGPGVAGLQLGGTFW
ncbi:MAG TPA: hypothetical protein VLQ93_09560 [Myxococcaceae bacterium]|nr:hypothetical protein [Myxococcaceae bacterium]